ncbi:MAG: hypothetical protein AAF268_16285 [Cyanobacteria bacterium P01_A01_bin.3]
MSRKSKVELSSRTIDTELFEPYHEHLDDYCRATKTDKAKLLEGFIRSLDIPDDDEFLTVDERILNLFKTLRPAGSSGGYSKIASKKKRAGRSRKTEPVVEEVYEDIDDEMEEEYSLN